MIELATPNDRPHVERLAKQIHQMHVDWRPDLFQMPEELFPEEQYSALLKNKELYVAKLNGAVAGFCWLKMRMSEDIGRIPRKIMEIHQLCVDEEFRNHGIGTQMVEEVRILAKAFGCTDLQLGVYPQNDAAVSFYQKCGFMIRSIDMQCKA